MLWHGKNFRGFLNKAREVLFDKTGTTLQSDNVQDAISEIDGNLTVQTATYTLNTTLINDFSDTYKTVWKYGKIVKFSLVGTIITSIPGTGGLLLTLPTGFRPSSQTRVQLICTYSGNLLFTTVNVNTNGEVTTAIGTSTLTGPIQVDGFFII